MHRQAGANCTDAKLYFWTIFQFFFIIQMGPGPTHPLPNYFWNFFNFAKPLTVLQSGSGQVIPVAFAGLWGGGALMTSPSSPTSVGLQGCPIGIPKNPEISGSSLKSSLGAAEEVHQKNFPVEYHDLGSAMGGSSQTE